MECCCIAGWHPAIALEHGRPCASSPAAIAARQSPPKRDTLPATLRDLDFDIDSSFDISHSSFQATVFYSLFSTPPVNCQYLKNFYESIPVLPRPAAAGGTLHDGGSRAPWPFGRGVRATIETISLCLQAS